MAAIRNEIGERLKAIRVMLGYTQADIAEYFGCTAASISDWERDKVVPGIDKLIALSKFYGLPFTVVLGTWEEEYRGLVMWKKFMDMQKLNI